MSYLNLSPFVSDFFQGRGWLRTTSKNTFALIFIVQVFLQLPYVQKKYCAGFFLQVPHVLKAYFAGSQQLLHEHKTYCVGFCKKSQFGPINKKLNHYNNDLYE